MGGLIRYCAECGHIGPVSRGKHSCCPASNAWSVHQDIAVQAHAGFKAALALHNAARKVGK